MSRECLANEYSVGLANYSLERFAGREADQVQHIHLYVPPIHDVPNRPRKED